MLTPRWGDDHDAVRGYWDLDPSVTFLNHGSFGATPRPVLEEQATLRAEMEAQPVRFLDRDLRPRLAEVRAELAAFLDAEEDGLAFVPNATTGVASVLASIPLGPDDEVVITDHAYNAVRLAVLRACERAGARLVVAMLAPDGASAAADVAAALTARTRLALIDHVVSWNGLVLDAHAVVAACRSRGVPIMIDAAHAPGMVEVSLRSLAPDLWVGNLHKWVCAPKGSGALWVAPHLRDQIQPAIISHGAEFGFLEAFDWLGTNDPTALLAIPAALRFLAEVGVDRMRAYNTALAQYAREVLADALGTEPAWPIARQAFMAGVPLGIDLPDKAATTRFHAFAYERSATEIPVMAWSGQTVLRASAQVYNTPAQYERYASMIPGIRAAYATSVLDGR
jgi:isopenicillin-N epimerase